MFMRLYKDPRFKNSFHSSYVDLHNECVRYVAEKLDRCKPHSFFFNSLHLSTYPTTYFPLYARLPDSPWHGSCFFVFILNRCAFAIHRYYILKPKGRLEVRWLIDRGRGLHSSLLFSSIFHDFSVCYSNKASVGPSSSS
jgi:hypothetical protein